MAAETGQTLIERLAERIRAFGPAQMTPQAIVLARTAIIDTLGVALAGTVEPCTTNLLRTPGVAAAAGSCTLFGTDRKTSALDATFVNGTASHALDYDDFSQPMGGHQSVPLVAPLIAIAEERRLSGAQLIQSYVVGIEAEIRLARAVNFHHYDKGWHPTATLGVFGTASAVGHMIGLDEAKLAVALAIAASLASGVKANFGTMVKPLHVGQCARNGLLAALLAEAGYDANPAALEHKQGFLNAYNGAGNYDAELMFANWANPLEVTSPTMGLKQFPCCGSTHPAVAMMLALRQEEGVTASAVERIEIMPHRRRLPHTDNPDPRTPLAAKFSVQYVVARALVDGAVRLNHFEGNAHLDPAIREIMGRTTARPHPDMADDAADQFGAEVRVTLRDGRILSRRVDGLIGRGGDNPMSSDELWEKFYDCGRRALPKQDILPLFERLESLEKVADIRDVTRMLAKRAPPGAGAARPNAVTPTPAQGNTLLETSWIP
ncbi:MAG: MmgE/PrpD family protein [Acetobacteraceae bacterium]